MTLPIAVMYGRAFRITNSSGVEIIALMEMVEVEEEEVEEVRVTFYFWLSHGLRHLGRFPFTCFRVFVESLEFISA